MEKNKYLNDYEEELIWMSYRYCIGRRSIASISHAHDIAMYSGDKINPTRKEFMAFDIRREIANSLQFSAPFSFIVDCNIPQDMYYPYEYFIEAIERYNLHSKEVICKINSIKCAWDYTNKQVYYIITYNADTTKFSDYKLNCSLHDLEPWNDLANFLDKKKHKKCKVRYEGKENILEYFESYVCTNEYNTESFYNFKKVKRDVESYRNLFGGGNMYINEEYIIEDNLPIDDVAFMTDNEKIVFINNFMNNNNARCISLFNYNEWANRPQLPVYSIKINLNEGIDFFGFSENSYKRCGGVIKTPDSELINDVYNCINELIKDLPSMEGNYKRNILIKLSR